MNFLNTILYGVTQLFKRSKTKNTVLVGRLFGFLNSASLYLTLDNVIQQKQQQQLTNNCNTYIYASTNERYYETNKLTGRSSIRTRVYCTVENN